MHTRHLSQNEVHPALNKLTRISSRLVDIDDSADDEVNICSKKALSILARGGILKYLVPKSFGGDEEKVNSFSLCVIRKFLSTFSAVADVMFAVQGLGSYPILLAGSQKLKKEYLPKAAKGSLVFAFGLTEPEAGSDINGLKTVAKKEKKGFVLNGTKIFISNAPMADVLVVFARLGKEIKGFVCTREMLKVKEQVLMAPHSIGEVYLQDVFVPVEHLLNGNGYKIATETLKMFRPTVGASACGLATRAFHEAVEFSKRRSQFGRPISEFQSIKFMLADMHTALTAAELLVFHSAMSGTLASEAKLLATEMASSVIDKALQIHGGRGLIKGSVVERLYRFSRAQRIYEGTSEVQRLIIAKDILKE